METSVDPVLQSTIVSGMSGEAAGASASRVRGWDLTVMSVASMWQIYFTSPSVMTGQGIRMLNGTPTGAPGVAPNFYVPGNTPTTG